MPILKTGTSGNGLGPSDGSEDVSSSVKALANWLLMMLALTWGRYELHCLFSMGEMPLLSHFFSLMKDHSFFGLLSSPETRSSI